MSLNPRHLTSLEAIARHGSFSAAGAAIGRSHSAISLHVKALEAELGTTLVDRTTRPPVLTPDGIALAEQAARYRSVMEDIRALGRSNRLTGTLSVGIVPTAMTHLAPAALARLRVSHPALSIEIRTGLSGGLAQAVRAAEIDAAVLTAPDLAPDGLRVHPVLDEPLVVIAPPDVSDATDRTLLTAHPFIWFSRATWAGQQIE
ncbi:MAG: LysR family transcriptional regulator, partial [Pseudomonadota bacterium]